MGMWMGCQGMWKREYHWYVSRRDEGGGVDGVLTVEWVIDAGLGHFGGRATSVFVGRELREGVGFFWLRGGP